MDKLTQYRLDAAHVRHCVAKLCGAVTEMAKSAAAWDPDTTKHDPDTETLMAEAAKEMEDLVLRHPPVSQIFQGALGGMSKVE